MDGVVKHGKFQRWLNVFKGLVDKNKKEPHIFIFACSQGKHRSVAASMIVAHILEKEGFVVTRKHMCENTWHRSAVAKSSTWTDADRKPMLDVDMWCII